MNKYDKPMYNTKYIQNALKISWWERVVLLLVPAVKVENEESISHFKRLRGKFYLMDFQLKNLN